MSLPDDVRRGVEQALVEHGLGRRITSVQTVGGGCINHGARVETDSGTGLFLKWNRGAPPGMFAAEADGLQALARATSLRVPEPRALHDGDGATPWLLMEYIAAGPASASAQTTLGRGLAELHAASTAGDFGWERDNWIGSLDQANGPLRSWADFWRDRRIAPQLALARERGRALDPTFDQLVDVIPAALADVDGPELLHGDLWGGNWFAAEGGEPVLVDPAVYRGHGEVDLAMSELFGGFGPAFYDAYDDVRGIPDSYAAYRKDVYQLYYLLVHVNLFGSAYESGSLKAARSTLAELR